MRQIREAWASERKPARAHTPGSVPGAAHRSETRPRIAYQGEPGAFSEEAALVFCAGAITLPQPDFDAVAEAVMRGHADYGVLPIENSIAGPITNLNAVLEARGLRVIRELVRGIHQCLLALPGAPLDGVRRVLSHPVALRQCHALLSGLDNVEAVEVHDTAGAARIVAQSGDPALAAIASRAAAARHGLAILAYDIEDHPNNLTRFAVVSSIVLPPP